MDRAKNVCCCTRIMQMYQSLRVIRCVSFSTSIATGVRRKPALLSTRLGQAYSASSTFQRDIQPCHLPTQSFTSSTLITRSIASTSSNAADADMTSQPKMSELSDKTFGELSALTTCEVSHGSEECILWWTPDDSKSASLDI